MHKIVGLDNKRCRMYGTCFKKVNIFILHSIVLIAIIMELITVTYN